MSSVAVHSSAVVHIVNAPGLVVRVDALTTRVDGGNGPGQRPRNPEMGSDSLFFVVSNSVS